MRTILINVAECARELGGISTAQVMTYIHTADLPCIRLTRRTIKFDLEKVKHWANTRPTLRKTKKQIEAERRTKQRRAGVRM
jgi:hypothetical protein